MNTATEYSARSRASARFECRTVTRRITCCEDDQLPQLLGGRIFHIKEGRMTG